MLAVAVPPPKPWAAGLSSPALLSYPDPIHSLGSPFCPGKAGSQCSGEVTHLGVCGLTEVSSCAALLFEGCASSGMQWLLPRNGISGSL